MAPQAPSPPAAELAALARIWLALSQPTDWDGVDRLPGIKWAPLPATELRSCLPNGDCYARQGTGVLGGRSAVVVATGARTIVMTILIRNLGAPLGEAAVSASLEAAGLAPTLARCPTRTGVGGTSWYRLAGVGVAPGFLSVQPPGPGRPNEGYVITAGSQLPALQPNQLAHYTEQCAPGADRKPVATAKPHEQLARTLVALLVPAAGAALYDWKALTALPTGITWTDGGPKPVDLTSRGDFNPLMLSGSATYAGRRFSVMATGSAAEVKAVHVEELGLHPRGEHLLGVVYERGIVVRLVRCGPIYTESTNNWYGLTSAGTRPAHVRQSIRHDGQQVQDSYELRLDGSLPARDPRDRDPGVNGCQ
jgi:hypothetical protein